MFDYSKPKEYYDDSEKVGLCYLWTACINENAFYGRTLESAVEFFNDVENLTLFVNKVVYIHNAAFEFQWLRNVMSDLEVFARKKRKPIYFKWSQTFEFRCSYMLTRLSLDSWAKTKKLKHQKLVGDLDYNVMRTPFTKITNEELGYAIADVRVGVDGIQQFKDTYKHIKDIPITQTGVVRKKVTSLMREEKNYHRKMASLLPDTVEEYSELISVFGGGKTLANRLWVDTVCEGLKSRDKTSAYPWAMISKKFPMSKFAKSEPLDIFFNNDNYGYIITVEMYGVNSNLWCTYLSSSKCTEIKNGVYDNGRVISADFIKATFISIDYELVRKSYHIEKIVVNDFKYCIMGYLNNTFRRYILEVFGNKTSFKGVPGMEELYARSKEEFNSLFGMAVTRDITDEILFNDDWDVRFLTREIFNDKVEKKLRNISKLNFAYSHGVFIPAYQRRSLWSAICSSEVEMDSSTVYMDTDSYKYFSSEEIESYFEEYNNKIRERQEELANDLDVDVKMFRPCTPKGIECSLGEYVLEDTYKGFITQGAKRYAYEDDDGIHITVSGVNKKKGASQIKSLDEFRDGLVFDYEHSGKSILHYNDDQPTVTFCKGKYDEFISTYKYAICLQPTTYVMSKTEEFIDLITSIANSQTALFARSSQRLKGDNDG